MQNSILLHSKVLIHENDIGIRNKLKSFCLNNYMIPIRGSDDCILRALRANVDLGAIFLSSQDGNHGQNPILLARDLHLSRPELPLVLRVSDEKEFDQLKREDRELFVGCFTLDNLDQLTDLCSRFLFNMTYPTTFVRGVQEITLSALQSEIKDVTIELSPPYLVKDNLIFGELFSLVPLESKWCRGYMMLQLKQSNITDLIASQSTKIKCYNPNLRDVNEVLSEITNLIWGGIKSRFFTLENSEDKILTQVPIMVNHSQHCMSFGSSQPQLCIRYSITSGNLDLYEDIVLYQKFIFNLSWSPEMFNEVEQSVDELVESGELELF